MRKDNPSKDNCPITVAFVGNPNCGKTTLFNAFTGAKLKVANWPGVTVERVEGETNYEGHPIRVIDTPGVYSLTSYTIEEIVTRKCIEEENIDVIINVVDAPPAAGDAGTYSCSSRVCQKAERSGCADACRSPSL